MAKLKSTNSSMYYDDNGMAYDRMKASWSYSTSSDELTLIYINYGDSELSKNLSISYECMSQEKALATLEQLINWCDVFEGKKALDNILKKYRKEE